MAAFVVARLASLVPRGSPRMELVVADPGAVLVIVPDWRCSHSDVTNTGHAVNEGVGAHVAQAQARRPERMLIAAAAERRARYPKFSPLYITRKCKRRNFITPPETNIPRISLHNNWKNENYFANV